MPKKGKTRRTKPKPPAKKSNSVKEKKHPLDRYTKAINLTLGFLVVFVFLCLELTIVMSGILATKKPINPQNPESNLTKTTNGASIDASTGEVTANSDSENTPEQGATANTESSMDKTPAVLACESDADCTPLFSNCSCGYSCVNEEAYNQVSRVSCNAICTQEEKANPPSCLCRNNRCVKK